MKKQTLPRLIVRRKDMRSQKTAPESGSLTSTIRELARFFRRNGYIRYQKQERLTREGYMGYKKGDEVRMTAQNLPELEGIRQLLMRAGFTPGRPFVKGKQYRLPIYGRAEVRRFKRLMDGVSMAKPVRPMRGRRLFGGRTTRSSEAAGSQR